MRDPICSRPWAMLALPLALTLLFATSPMAQSVPQVIRFSGTAIDGVTSHPVQGPAGATFAIYARAEGGAAIWQEVQNITTDPQGRYSVLLGAASREGVPSEIFASGEARWLGISINGAPESQRVQLVSVPYAMKAKEADTLNGMSASEIAAYAAVMGSQDPARPADGKGRIMPSATTRGEITPNAVPVDNASATFTDTNSTEVVKVTQNGTGRAITSSNNGNTATIFANNAATTGTSAFGILATSSSTNGAAVRGEVFGASAANIGIWGVTHGSGGTGILGESASTTGASFGLRGKTASSSGIGLQGQALSGSGNTVGIYAIVASPLGRAMLLDGVGGKLLSARTSSVEKFAVDGNGNVSAAGNIAGLTISGSGAGVTNLNASNLASGTVPASVLNSSVDTAALVDNSVTAAKLAHDTLSIPALSFNGLEPGMYYTGGTVDPGDSGASADVHGAAAVLLPSGTTVSKLRICGRDFAGDKEIRAQLKRKLRTDSVFSAPQLLAEIGSGVVFFDTNAQCFETSTISNAVIDAVQYTYWVELFVGNTTQATVVQIDH